MATIEVGKTGLIYRNPKPHVRSVHAYFPSVGVLPGGELVAVAALAEAFEATNMRTNVFRSTDGGETWTHEGLLYPGTRRKLTSDSSRLTVLPDGRVVVYTMRCDRSEHRDEGFANPVNLGFVPTEPLLFRSGDGGRSWSKPAELRPPLVGPSFEMCSPITVLRDGRWLLPTQTWPGWDGSCPNGIRMVAFVSEDEGRSWPEYRTIMREPAGRVYFWESKIIEMADGALVAVAWVYDDGMGKDRPNVYAVSRDGGSTWTAPMSTGLLGQTMTPLALEGNRILSVYRRMDKTGLWANVSRMEGDRWVNEAEAPLWGANAGGLTGASTNMVQNFNVLRFGAPCLARLPDGTVFAAFWGYEDCVSGIRWFKLRVS